MSLDIEALLALDVQSEQCFDARDTMLYALGLGIGADPLDETSLRFVYEKDLQAMPTMALTVAFKDLTHHYDSAGVSRRRLHGEQSLTLNAPFPSSGRISSRTRGISVVDKGPGKGLILYYGTELTDRDTGMLVATLKASTFCLDDGGAAGHLAAARSPFAECTPPPRAADWKALSSTFANTALIYRLSGDYNPLHVVPALARKFGMPQPALHGRCTFGIVAHALIRNVAGNDARRLRTMTGRFRAPAYPGESIQCDMWIEPEGIFFLASVPERDVVVIDRGFASFANPST